MKYKNLRGRVYKNSSCILIVCKEQYPVKIKKQGIWIYRDWDSIDAEKGDLRVFSLYSNTTNFNEMKKDQFRKFDEYNGYCKYNTNLPCDLFHLS